MSWSSHWEVEGMVDDLTPQWDDCQAADHCRQQFNANTQWNWRHENVQHVIQIYLCISGLQRCMMPAFILTIRLWCCVTQCLNTSTVMLMALWGYSQNKALLMMRISLDFQVLNRLFNNYMNVWNRYLNNSVVDILLKTTDVNFMVALKEKSKDHKVSRFHPLRTMNPCATYQSNSSNSCWDISVCNSRCIAAFKKKRSFNEITVLVSIATHPHQYGPLHFLRQISASLNMA